MRRPKSRRRRLAMLGQITAQERPKGAKQYAQECLEIGADRPPHYPFGSYRVCLTKTQRAALFKNKSIRQIGCGTFACAYEHPNPNLVVKITRDEQDVGGLLLARNSGLVPEVYDAYELRGGGRSLKDGKKTRVYAVVADRLRPLTEAQRLRLRPFEDALQYGVSGLMSPQDTCCDPYDPMACNRLCLDVLQLGRGLQDLGVDWLDTHGGNVGYDSSGKLRVLDVGRSEVPAPALQVLAGRRRRAQRVMRWRRRR